MSREEREEAYNKARERIFGTASTEISTPGINGCALRVQRLDSADDYAENDDSTGVSRASSVSMRDRINGAKKAKKRRDSDTFDTRSNYIAYAPAYGHPHQATWAQPHYMPAGAPLNGSVQQQAFPPAVPNMYGVPNQQFPPMVPGNGYGPPYNNITNVSQGEHGADWLPSYDRYTDSILDSMPSRQARRVINRR